MVNSFNSQEKRLYSTRLLTGKISRVIKLTSLMLGASIGLAFAGQSLDQKKTLSLTLSNTTVKKVLDTLEKQTNYHFFYNSKFIDVNRMVSVDVQAGTLSTVLGQLFHNTDIHYKVMENDVILTIDHISENGMNENQEITGTVTDHTGEAIIGVNVIVKGSTRGTITDINGRYVIDAPSNAILQFSYIGYTPKEFAIEGRSVLNVQLTEDLQALDEVIVVGYGTQIKRDITGSVQSLKTEELENIPAAQLSQKMQGKFAGVQINQTTGKPGQGMTMRIRGQASLSGGTTPLYVVDGMPIVGDLANINPDEIENISILKDASATSLYGSRAANGVVLIQTKSLEKGKRLSFDAYAGIQFVPEQGRPDMMNASEFARFKKEIAEENGLPVDPAYQHPETLGKGTDWYDVLFKPAAIQNYSLTYGHGSGGFKSTTVAGYFKQDGVLRNSDYQRFSVRTNTEYTFSDIVRIGVNVAPSYSIRNTPSSDGVWWANKGVISGAMLTTPLAPYKNEDGTIPLTATGPGMFDNPNWYNVTLLNKNKTQIAHLISNAFLEIQPIKNLKLKTSINADLTSSKYTGFKPSTSGETYTAPYRIARANEDSYLNYTWMWENTVTYTKQIGNHSFDILAGLSAQKYHGESTSLYGTDFPDDKIETLNAASTITASSNIEEWSLLSYIGRLNYNYKGRYLLSAAIRRDGSSRFGFKNRWGNFPSVSLGWIASDESFMEPLKDKLTFLKIRASYGIVGNDQIGNYTHLATISTTNYNFNNTLAPGRSMNSMGNPMLGWERNKQLDLGLDLALFNNRISFMYDYYDKRTDALLFALEVPISSGFFNIQSNAGKLKFWGHEFTLTTKNLTGDFQWTTDLNISYNDNLCLSLGEDNAPIIGDNITKVGERIGQFYGLVWEGVYKNQEEFNNYPKHTQAAVGTIRYKDVSGDGIITQGDDRDIIGNPVPLWLLGMTNTFSWKNFDCSIVLSGGFGFELANMVDVSAGNLDGVFNVYKAVDRRWKSPDNPGDGRYGTTKIGTTGPERDWFSSRFLYNANYLTIKNITLGYTVPFKSTDVIKRLRAYVSFQNVYTFTSYIGANPEVNIDNYGNTSSTLTQGFDYATYPVPRTVTLGFNINF